MRCVTSGLHGARRGQPTVLLCCQSTQFCRSPLVSGRQQQQPPAARSAASAAALLSAAAATSSLGRRASRRAPSPHARQQQLSSVAAASSGRSASAAAAAEELIPSMAAAPGEAVSLRAEVSALFRAAIAAAFPGVDERVSVAACNNASHGDYQCNNAMSLFGKLRGKEGAPKSPRDVATALLAALPANGAIAGTSLAGPGFINIKLQPAFLAARLDDMLVRGLVATMAPKLAVSRVVVDFSSPNVAKEMHVGHLRSTIIGDTICKSLEFCGVKVQRLNHIGDWGTQFGMLIQHMAELRPEGLAASKDEDVADLQQLYRAAKKRFDEDEEFKIRAREGVTRLQSGDEECLAAWRRICAASRKEFDAIYSRLGVTLNERGESFYNPMLKGVVEELTEKGVAEVSEGAVCVFIPGKEVPLIVQKSDGGFGYASTDMAALKHRLTEEQAEWIIYVTDVGQAPHFELVFAAGRRAGWLPEDPNQLPRVSHVGFGLVLGEDGKKFKTRSGDVVRLVELLDEAKSRCYESLKTRRDEAGEAYEEAELDTSAAAMGYGAVKYADLRNARTTNYKFSFDTMLALTGNTAVYLEYAHARIAGIVRKSGRDVDALVASGGRVSLVHPKEVALGLALCKFPEVMEDMLSDLMPNRITEYLYDVSDAFNSFYSDCKVLGSDEEDSRLLLAEATARIMRQCFFLLGITPLYRI